MKRSIAPAGRPTSVSADPRIRTSAFPLGDYLLPARDATGGHVSMNTVTMPSHLRVASRLVSQALFGFENTADVMRWCLQYGMDELARRSKDPEIMGAMQTLRLWLVGQQAELEHARYFSHYQSVEDGVEMLQAAGHEPRAMVLAERVWSTSDRVGSPYWQRRFRKLAEKKMKDLRPMVADTDEEEEEEEKGE